MRSLTSPHVSLVIVEGMSVSLRSVAISTLPKNLHLENDTFQMKANDGPITFPSGSSSDSALFYYLETRVKFCLRGPPIKRELCQFSEDS